MNKDETGLQGKPIVGAYPTQDYGWKRVSRMPECVVEDWLKRLGFWIEDQYRSFGNSYMNKCYTIVDASDMTSIAVYKHDWSWWIIQKPTEQLTSTETEWSLKNQDRFDAIQDK